MAYSPRGFKFGDRAAYVGYRFGTFVCWTNNIPFGTDVYVDNRENPPFDVTGWAPSAVDCEDWVDFSASIGAEYCVLTVQHNMGWSLYPFQTNMATWAAGKDSYNASISLPQVQDYGVGNAAIVGTADQDIVHRFVARCINQGIKPVLYYNIGKDINSRGGHSSIQAAAFATDVDIAAGYDGYCTMVEARLTELLTAFPTVWLWLDAVAWYPRTHHQALFDAIREAGNENTLIFYNYEVVAGSGNGANEVTKPTGTHANYPGTLDGTQMYLWPFDIASYEYSRLPTASAAEMGTLQSHLKHIYWRGAEVSSPVYTDQWFYWDQAIVGGTPNVLTSEASLNTRADSANDNAAPFLLALSPHEDGVIPTAQKNRVTAVAAHIFP